MPLRAPISHHLDLYRYWLTLRGERTMPARSDIDPADIRALLPYLTIVDKVDGRFRFRLVGTAAAEQFGHDLTGKFVGSYTGTLERAAVQNAIYERLFTTARPLFIAGEYLTHAGAIHKVSRFMLPLSDNGVNVNKVFFTRVARFSPNVKASADWLKGTPGKTRYVVEVFDMTQLQKLCLDWERNAPAGDVTAKDLLQC
jgi:hypothetical protein